MQENMDKCIFCGTPYKHKRIYKSGWVDPERTLKEVTFILAHPCCRALLRKKKNLQQQLLDIEYDIFMKKYNINNFF
jgi:hypothetical protein